MLTMVEKAGHVMADWQYAAIWITGTILITFLAYLWIEDEETAAQVSVAGLFWPIVGFMAAVGVVTCSPIIPLVAVVWAARKTRAWAKSDAPEHSAKPHPENHHG